MTTPDLDADPSGVPPTAERAWTDPTIPPDARLDSLLAEMTLEEKLGQLGSKWLGFARKHSANVGPMQDAFAPTTLSFEQARRHGLGHITRAFGTTHRSRWEYASCATRSFRRSRWRSARVGRAR
jgi:hypothetical protein